MACKLPDNIYQAISFCCTSSGLVACANEHATEQMKERKILLILYDDKGIENKILINKQFKQHQNVIGLG